MAVRVTISNPQTTTVESESPNNQQARSVGVVGPTGPTGPTGPANPTNVAAFDKANAANVLAFTSNVKSLAEASLARDAANVNSSDLANTVNQVNDNITDIANARADANTNTLAIETTRNEGNSTLIIAASAYDQANTVIGFSNISVGGTFLIAGANTDLLSIIQGNNAVLTANAANDTYAINIDLDSSWSHANLAYLTSGSAYDHANAISVSTNSYSEQIGTSGNNYTNVITGSAHDTANDATTIAASAYDQANTVLGFSNISVGGTFLVADANTDLLTIIQGNNATLTANAANDTYAINIDLDSSWSHANLAYLTSGAAYDQANTATTDAADALASSGAAYDQANTATTSASDALASSGAAYDQANTATTDAADALASSGAAFDEANDATTTAASAYDHANTRYSASGGTISGDTVITGNLVVSGETTYANTQHLLIGDALISLNHDLPDATAPSEDAGVEVNRGSSDNVSVLWDESDDVWTFSNDGSIWYQIASNVDVDNAGTAANAYADSVAGPAHDAANSIQVFSNVGIDGTTYIVADAQEDLLSLISGNNISLSANAANDGIGFNVDLSPAWDHAETSSDEAGGAHTTANSAAAEAVIARGDTNTNATNITTNAAEIVIARGDANTASLEAGGAHDTANDATIIAASAYDQANTVIGFSNISVGGTFILADANTDLLTIIEGNNATLTANAANDTYAINIDLDSSWSHANLAYLTSGSAYDAANAFSELSEDLSPQLGANLDAQSFGIENIADLYLDSGAVIYLADDSDLLLEANNDTTRDVLSLRNQLSSFQNTYSFYLGTPGAYDNYLWITKDDVRIWGITGGGAVVVGPDVTYSFETVQNQHFNVQAISYGSMTLADSSNDMVFQPNNELRFEPQAIEKFTLFANGTARFADANLYVNGTLWNTTAAAAYDQANTVIAFSNISVGGAFVVADANTDLLSIIQGNNAVLTANAANDSYAINIDLDPAWSHANLAYLTSGSAYDAANGIQVFSNVGIDGTTYVVADAQEDLLSLISGNNITLSANNANDSIAINVDLSPAWDHAETSSDEAAGAHGTANDATTTAGAAYDAANAFSELVEDTTPQLGGELDAQGENFANTGHLIPLTTNTSNLGSSTLRYRDIFIGGGGGIYFENASPGSDEPSIEHFDEEDFSDGIVIRGDLHLLDTSPIIYLRDTNTNANSRIRADSSSGSLYLDADFEGAAGTTRMVFTVDGTEYVELYPTRFNPNNSGTVSLGGSTNSWLDLYLDNGGSIYFNGTAHEINHSGNTISFTGTTGVNVSVDGHFSATSKSFDIEHPTQPGRRLVHGSLEGPEHGVYVRGTSSSYNIQLPEYWRELVDWDSITVQLTSRREYQQLYVTYIDKYSTTVHISDTMEHPMVEYDYFIQASRKDVKLQVEV